MLTQVPLDLSVCMIKVSLLSYLKAKINMTKTKKTLTKKEEDTFTLAKNIL